MDPKQFSQAVVVVGAKFSFRRSPTAHPDYNRIIATVQGDLIKELT